MKIVFAAAPWTKAKPNANLRSVNKALEGVWRDTAETFYAEVVAAQNTGEKMPQGMQRHLNDAIDRRLVEAGWEGKDGRFVKGDTWLRITFRHQMGLGSDVLDALRVTKLEGIAQCAIVCAPRALLNLISPNDAPALCSAEKLTVKLRELDGALDFALFAGVLETAPGLPPDVRQHLEIPRPRRA